MNNYPSSGVGCKYVSNGQRLSYCGSKNYIDFFLNGLFLLYCIALLIKWNIIHTLSHTCTNLFCIFCSVPSTLRFISHKFSILGSQHKLSIQSIFEASSGSELTLANCKAYFLYPGNDLSITKYLWIILICYWRLMNNFKQML